jgi:hypothetical protein
LKEVPFLKEILLVGVALNIFLFINAVAVDSAQLMILSVSSAFFCLFGISSIMKKK